MAVQIQWRRDTAANWTASNPILAEGEAGLETDTGKVKLGNGIHAWSVLPYFSGINAASAGTSSISSGTLVFSNSNGVSFGLSGSTITASVASAGGGIALSAGTQSASTGTVVFSNSNGISFGMSGSSRITASHNGISAVYVSAGLYDQLLSAITFSDANGVSFGLDGGSVITASVSNQGIALSAGTQSVSTGTLKFADSNGISFGMSDSSRVTASYTVPSTAGLISAINVSGGTTSNNLSALTFSDGGNVSFGLNGSVITASAPAGGGGALSVGMSTIGNTSGDTGLVESRLVLAGGNNITLSGNTGALNRMTITVSGPNVVLPSAGTQTAASGTVVFANSNGITFGMSGSSQITASHNGLTTQSAQAFSADASSTFQTLTFQDSNGISFSNNAGALRITHGLQFTSATSAITSNALNTSASRVINIVAATNNTAGGTASLSSNVSFSGANGITFYTSAGNAIVASYNSTQFAGTGTTFAGANASGSMTLNSNGLNLSVSVAAPGAAAEQNAINLLGANTAGNTTATGSTIGLSGIGIKLSGANNSQVVMSVMDATWQDWDNMKVLQSMNLISNITATAFSRGRPILFPLEMDGHLVWNKAMIDMSRSTSGSNAFTVGFGIYSFVNSTQISLMGSLQNAFSGTNTESISGIRRFELSGIGTGASSLTPGHYIGALQFSANGDSTASMNYSLRGGVTANPPVGLIRPGSDSNVTANLSSIALRHFRGFWSATSGNLPDTIGLTQVSMWTTGGHPYLWLGSN